MERRDCSSHMGEPPPPPHPASSSSSSQLLLVALQERLQSHMRNDSSLILQQMLLGMNSSLLSSPMDAPSTSCAPSHPLWHHQLCAWPGCDQPVDTFSSFLAHLASLHPLDERSALQVRQQIDLVDSLEHRLGKERTRLQAMMQHLHMKHSPDTTTPALGKTELTNENLPSTSSNRPDERTLGVIPSTIQVRSPIKEEEKDEEKIETVFSPSSVVPTQSQSSSFSSSSSCMGKRARVSDKHTLLPISTDITKNRDFYRTNDVRPPYTYASLIRQAIMDSPECQLTLNEIYNWFTDTFMYFRRNAATWKNAVRHNLSLHKCFARVEQNVKGAVWTVDDSEFYKRRSQRVNPTRSTPSTPSVNDSTSMARRLLESRLNEESSSFLDPSHPFSSLLTDNPLSLLAAASAFGSSTSLLRSADEEMSKPDLPSSAPPLSSCSLKEEDEILSQISSS